MLCCLELETFPFPPFITLLRKWSQSAVTGGVLGERGEHLWGSKAHERGQMSPCPPAEGALTRSTDPALPQALPVSRQRPGSLLGSHRPDLWAPPARSPGENPRGHTVGQRSRAPVQSPPPPQPGTSWQRTTSSRAGPGLWNVPPVGSLPQRRQSVLFHPRQPWTAVWDKRHRKGSQPLDEPQRGRNVRLSFPFLGAPSGEAPGCKSAEREHPAEGLLGDTGELFVFPHLLLSCDPFTPDRAISSQFRRSELHSTRGRDPQAEGP